MRTNTTRWIVGVGVVCVLLAVGVWVMRERSDGEPFANAEARPTPTAGVESSPAPTEAVQPTASPAGSSRPTGVQKLSYDAALRQFEGRRIQLDAQCNAIPSQVVYKTGTQVMLDNRGSQSQSVLFNLKRYTIPAYDYIVVSAVAETTPAVTYLDCGQKQNVAQITIQQ